VVTTPSKPKAEAVKATDKDKDKSNPDSPPKSKMLVNTQSTADEVPHAIPVKQPSNVEDQPPAPKPTPKSHVEDAPPAKPKTEPKTKSEDPKPKKTTKTDKSESKTASKSEKSSKNKETSSKRKTVVVGPKDTLYSISRKYGVSVDALQKANGIKDPTMLRDGSKLTIPSKSKD
jgi:LysM repeat protein